jgi:hypothetical protein
MKQMWEILTVKIAFPVLSSFRVGPRISVSKKKCFPFTDSRAAMSRSSCKKTQENISLGLEGGAGIRYPMFLIYEANSSNMVTFHVCIQRDCC